MKKSDDLFGLVLLIGIFAAVYKLVQPKCRACDQVVAASKLILGFCPTCAPARSLLGAIGSPDGRPGV
jgi:hypothetical protein